MVRVASGLITGAKKSKLAEPQPRYQMRVCFVFHMIGLEHQTFFLHDAHLEKNKYTNQINILNMSIKRITDAIFNVKIPLRTANTRQ